MAVYFASHATATTVTAVAAVAGKRIRVNRIIISSSASGGVTFNQDQGGGSEAKVLPTLEARSTGTALDFVFPEEKPQTAVGLSLGYETEAAGAHGIWIEYDLVA